ncbi:MAG: DUF4026 domain-containing protein [Ruminococcus sp.]|nr:DUF4026 domain-containing protein [Ruminococcus sp.]
MFQAENFIEQIRNAEHGASRLQLIQNAITEADAASDHYWRISFRYDYIKESIFHDDNFKAIIMFPELLSIFDENPDLEDEFYGDVMWAFKLVLENFPDYYQISREEIENYYAEYEKRCKKYNYSMRVFHMKRTSFYLPIDRVKAKAEHDASMLCKRDASCDCEACEINHRMEMALEFEDEETALRIAAPLLDGSKSCAIVPEVSYCTLMYHYLRQGNLTEADYYGKLYARSFNNAPEFLTETGKLMEMYSAVDIRAGWKVLKANIASFVKCKNPKMRMSFARGAYRILKGIGEETEYANSALLKPLPVQRTEEGYKVSELAEYFYNIAKEQSDLLDKRNGTSYFTDMLELEFAKAEAGMMPEPEGNYPAHGLIAKSPRVFAAVPKSDAALDLTAISERLNALSEQLEFITNEVENNVCYLSFRFEDRIYEAYILSPEINDRFGGRPCYMISREDYEAMQDAKQHLIVQMEAGDDAQLSYYLQMKILTTALPELLGVFDLTAEKVYPANWAIFAGKCRNSIALRDLFTLSISGSEESEEVWMTTIGLAASGMRELEIIGATKENYGYFADILFRTGCITERNAILPNAGEPMLDFTIGEKDYSLTWQLPAAALIGKEELLASKADRVVPSAVLCLYGDNTQLPEFEPMQECAEIEYENDRSEYIRHIYLSKETVPQLRNAYKTLSLAGPLEAAAARVEFTLSAEMREKYGYSKELLWADIYEIDGDTIKARIAETSELLPDCKEGDEIEITEENITGWFIRPEGSEEAFTEEDAFLFM